MKDDKVYKFYFFVGLEQCYICSGNVYMYNFLKLVIVFYYKEKLIKYLERL